MARLGVGRLELVAFCWGTAWITLAPAALSSFAGAEGASRYASGRSGDVYPVTNLAAAGPGSFRDGAAWKHSTRDIDA